MNDNLLPMGFIAGAVIATMLFLLCYIPLRDDFHRTALIDRGICEWQINSKTGEKSFVWLMGVTKEGR